MPACSSLCSCMCLYNFVSVMFPEKVCCNNHLTTASPTNYQGSEKETKKSGWTQVIGCVRTKTLQCFRTCRLNSSPHSGHMRLSSFSCSIKCALRLASLENFFPHSGHTGFSGLWMAMCKLRLSSTLNVWLHFGQRHGLSSSSCVLL